MASPQSKYRILILIAFIGGSFLLMVISYYLMGITPIRYQRARKLDLRLHGRELKAVIPQPGSANPATTESPKVKAPQPGHQEQVKLSYADEDGRQLLLSMMEIYQKYNGKSIQYGNAGYRNYADDFMASHPGDDQRVAQHQANINRLDQLLATRDLWTPDAPWTGDPNFRLYLLTLGLLRLRPAWQAGDTHALAQGIVDLIPLADMLTPESEREYSNLYWRWPTPMYALYEFLIASLDNPKFAYAASDWSHLDWSPLLKAVKPVSFQMIADAYDLEASRTQEIFRQLTRDPISRFIYLRSEGDWDFFAKGIQFTFQAGSIYDQLTTWREHAHAAITQATSLEVIFKLAGDNPIKLVPNSSSNPTGGPDPVNLTWRLTSNPGRLQMMDAALRLLRGDPIVNTPDGTLRMSGGQFGVLGCPMALSPDGDHRYRICFRLTGSLEKIVDSTPEYRIYRQMLSILGGLRFRTREPLPQAAGLKK